MSVDPQIEAHSGEVPFQWMDQHLLWRREPFLIPSSLTLVLDQMFYFSLYLSYENRAKKLTSLVLFLFLNVRTCWGVFLPLSPPAFLFGNLRSGFGVLPLGKEGSVGRDSQVTWQPYPRRCLLRPFNQTSISSKTLWSSEV